MSHAIPDERHVIPTEAERLAFRASLRGQALETIRDRIYGGEYGPYDPSDARNSSWRVRESNRYITAEQRRAELRPQWIGIVLSTLMSLAALVVSVLAYMKQK